MSIWTEGKRSFMFAAYSGRKLKKTVLQHKLRANQLANQKRAQALGNGNLKSRRRHADIRQQTIDCYTAHETINKTIDLKPFVTPPKDSRVIPPLLPT